MYCKWCSRAIKFNSLTIKGSPSKIVKESTNDRDQFSSYFVLASSKQPSRLVTFGKGLPQGITSTLLSLLFITLMSARYIPNNIIQHNLINLYSVSAV